MLVLAELAGVRLVLDGDLSPTQEARARRSWAMVARFIAPTLRQVIADAREADAGALELVGADARRARRR